MDHVEKSIEIEAPVSVVYNQWTQFEEFPRFMEGVQEVRQLDDKRLWWRAEIGGKVVEWDAEIFEQIPDQRIAWRSTTGVLNTGMVNFEPLDSKRTRVSLKLNYRPHGALEKIASAVGMLSMRVEGDLQRFKEFIEGRGSETGAWRGSISGKQVHSRGDGPVATSENEPRSKRQLSVTPSTEIPSPLRPGS